MWTHGVCHFVKLLGKQIMVGKIFLTEEAGDSNVSDFFPGFKRWDLQGRRRRLKRRFDRLYGIFDEFIDARLKAPLKERDVSETEHEDFLDTLTRFRVDKSEKKIGRETMKSLLTDVFLGGSDTSWTTVEWATAELLHNPNSMAKAHAELSQAFTKSMQLDESNILNLPYLQAVVKEVPRLHPPIPFLLPRRTETSIEKFFRYKIPNNSRVLVNTWVIGRDEKVWKDAEMFKPESFLERDVEYKGKDFELIPFGGGRRICPGLPLASRMVHLMLAASLHEFEWKLSDGMMADVMDLSERFGVTLALATPVLAIPVPVEPYVYVPRSRRFGPEISMYLNCC